MSQHNQNAGFFLFHIVSALISAGHNLLDLLSAEKLCTGVTKFSLSNRFVFSHALTQHHSILETFTDH